MVRTVMFSPFIFIIFIELGSNFYIYVFDGILSYCKVNIIIFKYLLSPLNASFSLPDL